jgi:trimeric autotransporter adhesin
MRISGAAALLLATLLTPTLVPAGQSASGALVCRHAKLVRGDGAPRPAVRPTMAGDERPLQLGRPRTVCLPAVGSGEAPELTTALAAWEVRRKRGTDVPGDRSGEAVALETSLNGAFDASLAGLTRVLVTASAAPGNGGAPPLPPPGTDFHCHGLRTTAKSAPSQSLVTAFGAHELRVERPRRYCDDPAARGWVCHRARATRGSSSPRGDVVSLDTPFGAAVLRLGPVTEVCVPSLGDTVPPTFTVRVEPASRTIEWRETADARAFADYPDGHSEEITHRVVWSAADHEVAALADPPAAGRFFGRAPGTTTLVATDPVTLASGTGSLTVEWTLQSIDIQPAQVNRVVGQTETYQATGTFASGATHNVTPRLVWSTGDESIAIPDRTGAGPPSRVKTLAFGTTTVRACDPITNVCSNDATLIVLGGLQSIVVSPTTQLSIEPGASMRLTAVGHYADGRKRNLTQRVEWLSSEPAVAIAPNTGGDRSRIDGIAPGLTFVRARDPQTGMESFGVAFYVLGALREIHVHPFDAFADAVRPPGSRRYTAIGEYVGGGHRNITQEVTWHSRDADVATAPNAPGDKSRIDSAGGTGVARIWAEDPSGIASGDVHFRALGDVTSLDILGGGCCPPFGPLPIGAQRLLRVRGTFAPDGMGFNFSRFFPDDYVIVSSDPSIADIVDGHSVRGVTAGVTTVKAVDLPSGFESPPFEVIVQGELQRIELSPRRNVSPAGTFVGLTVIGHFPPGITSRFADPIIVTSSNEQVAKVTGIGKGRVGITSVGPGTTTITVTDPRTGISTTDSGDDAVLTFFPNEAPLFVTVTPPVATIPVDGFDDFTAVATFANGQTLNVTQRATWTSSEPTVAELVGTLPPGFSRFNGLNAGLSTLSATYEGVSSSSSGHDGIVIVSDALSLDVLGAADPLAVGEERALRATALLANGRILNVTKMLEWASLDGAIADFLDEEAPTIVTGIAEGEVDIDVGLPNSGVGTTVRLTVTDDPITTTTSTPTTTTTTTTIATPSPLRLEPASATVDFGQTTRFRAMRGTVDVSSTVMWAVDDPTVARTDAGSTTATDPGSTAIRVLDTTTGSVAAASLTVEWSLRGITLWPRQANRAVGDWERFTALGTFGRGGTAVVTDRLQYAVADPAVAALQSSAANPSEVVALQSGRTTISACDPLTSVCSGDAGSAMLLVGGGLQSITIAPGSTVSHFIGEHEQYTATGHFADGSSQDLTQIVTWSVSKPSVARASNTNGTRGRVYALTPGHTTVSATDPESGIVSTASGNFVALGTLLGIYLDPPLYMQAGTSQQLRAIGFYDGGDRDFTQAVTYEVDDTAVATTPNAAGDRSRLNALTPGITTARARLASPAKTSNDVPVYVFGDIVSMQVDVRGKPHTGIGGELSVNVHATFDSPGFFYSEALGFSGRPYQLVSDAPGVLEVIDGRTVRGVSGGIANLTAVDPASGTTSAPVAITVRGELQSISLSPNGVVRAIGETQSFAANGHYVPALTGLLTQQLEYHSSDESVAIALNTPGNKSQVVMVGAGTAVISATDPVTGISSTDSGGDVTVTVRPGLLDRIVVSPPFVRRMFLDDEEFTATGYYPDGSSINVTQQVEWISSDSSVAGAFGPPNRRSLFTAEGPGTAVIRAVHPQGVSSTDSGHDAVMEVDQVLSLRMTPAQRTVQPGWSTQFTVRATMASGADVNVTQQAFYFTTRPNVVSVPNVPPRKSETIAVAPGQATIQAFFGFRGTSATLDVVGGSGSPSGAFLE